MALEASERATEVARPAGNETGGGAVDGTRARAKDGATASFEDVLLRVDVPHAAVDCRVDIAAVIAAGRPVDQQREAIDQKRETLEQSRRREQPAGAGSAADAVRERARPDGEHGALKRPPTLEAGSPDGASGQETLEECSEAVTSLGEGNAASSATRAAPGMGDPSKTGDGSAPQRSAAANGALAAQAPVGPPPPTPRVETAADSARSIPSVGSVTGTGNQGAAGAGAQHGEARDAMSRLVGLGIKQRGAMTAGRGESPFKVEEEAALSAQVSRGLAQVLKRGGGQITLRLRPEHLGEVRAHVRIENGVVGVRIEAASAEARALLERETATLRSALEARGLEVERVRIEGPARSPEHSRDASSETAREREDHASGDQGKDRPADGDRPRNQDEALGGWRATSRGSERGVHDRSPEPEPEPMPMADARCAYGAVSWMGGDGVLRLDATA